MQTHIRKYIKSAYFFHKKCNIVLVFLTIKNLLYDHAAKTIQ